MQIQIEYILYLNDNDYYSSFLFSINIYFRYTILWTFWNWKTLTHFCNQTKPLETTSSIKLNSKPTLTLLHTNLDVCITYGVLIFLQHIETAIHILSKLSLEAATYAKKDCYKKPNILRKRYLNILQLYRQLNFVRFKL